jgi:hypothetical protein
VPQVTKGGKYVFGISVIRPDGAVIIPPEAMQEYKYSDVDIVLLMSGSRTSGGFVLTVKRLIEKSEIYPIFYKAPGLVEFSLPEMEIVKNAGRSFCWTVIQPGGHIVLATRALSAYGIKPGDRLTAVRGSNYGITFLAKGPLWQRIVKHTELVTFGG